MYVIIAASRIMDKLKIWVLLQLEPTVKGNFGHLLTLKTKVSNNQNVLGIGIHRKVYMLLVGV